jgi:hypothetical protein
MFSSGWVKGNYNQKKRQIKVAHQYSRLSRESMSSRCRISCHFHPVVFSCRQLLSTMAKSDDQEEPHASSHYNHNAIIASSSSKEYNLLVNHVDQSEPWNLYLEIIVDPPLSGGKIPHSPTYFYKRTYSTIIRSVVGVD